MYSTFDKVAQEIKGTNVNQGPLVQQQIMGYLRTITARVRRYGYEFEPYYDELRITPDGSNVSTLYGTLILGAMLLEPWYISVNNVVVTYGSDVLAYPNNGTFPIKMLRIADLWSGPLKSWFPVCGNPRDVIESIVIRGLWGFRQYYNAEGFQDSSVDSPVLDDSQKTFIVPDIVGPDANGRVPLFSPGNLLRINNELIGVVDVTPNPGGAGGTLTVRRGARLTTRATHPIDSDILIWEPEEDIMNMATRQAALMYARRGAYQQITLADGTTVSYPPDLLSEAYNTVRQFDYAGEA